MTRSSYNVIEFSELDSTNSYASRNLVSLNDKDVIIARTQTDGRGRIDRKWISEKTDNIYMSIILKPCGKITELPLGTTTHYLSVILCRTLEQYGVAPEIKWPNDTLVDKKKIAGILSLSNITGQKLNGYIIGIGVNLNLTINDIQKISQPATALNILTGKFVNPILFRERLLNLFFSEYEQFIKEGFAFVRAEYINRSNYLGTKVSLSSAGKQLSGIAKTIDHSGALVLSIGGQPVRIMMGEMDVPLAN